MRFPSFRDGGNIALWSADLSRVLDRVVSSLESTKQTRGEVVFLRPYLVSELPDPVPDWQYIVVEDEVGGAIPAFSQGGQWRRVSDRAVVS